MGLDPQSVAGQAILLALADGRATVTAGPKLGAAGAVKPHLSEAEFQSQVIALAQLNGWKVAHFRHARTASGGWVTPVAADGKGWPDLFMVRRESCVVAELKVRPNKVTAEQDQWLTALDRSGLEVYEWYPEDWPEIERVLQ